MTYRSLAAKAEHELYLMQKMKSLLYKYENNEDISSYHSVQLSKHFSILYFKDDVGILSLCHLPSGSFNTDTTTLIQVYSHYSDIENISSPRILESYYNQSSSNMVRNVYNDFLRFRPSIDDDELRVIIPTVQQMDLSTEEGEFQFITANDDSVLDVMKYLQYITRNKFDRTFTTSFSDLVPEAIAAWDEYYERFQS